LKLDEKSDPDSEYEGSQPPSVLEEGYSDGLVFPVVQWKKKKRGQTSF